MHYTIEKLGKITGYCKDYVITVVAFIVVFNGTAFIKNMNFYEHYIKSTIFCQENCYYLIYVVRKKLFLKLYSVL